MSEVNGRFDWLFQEMQQLSNDLKEMRRELKDEIADIQKRLMALEKSQASLNTGKSAVIFILGVVITAIVNWLFALLPKPNGS